MSLKFTIEIAKREAEVMGGECLSKEYKNNHENISWKCKDGHLFYKPADSIRNQKQWCPECSVWRSQKELADIIEEIFKSIVVKNCKNFDWLKIARRRMEIDIYVPAIKVAIEYDGEQHFRPVCFGGRSMEDAITDLKKVKKRDLTKNRLIKSHIKSCGPDIKYFLRFNYKEELTKDYVLKKLMLAGII